MTTKQLDQEDTLEEFIDTVEETKEEQHPEAEDAVCGYVEDIEKRDGYIFVTIDIPAYDDQIEDKVAEVNGEVQRKSLLSNLVDNIDDIANLPIQDPIPCG